MFLAKLILFSIAIFQGAVIGFTLLNSPFFKSKSNRFLAFALFSASWILLDISLEITDSYKTYPFLKFIEIFDALLLFPSFILLFVMHQVQSYDTISKKKYRLFIPALSIIIILILLDLNIQNTEEINENNALIVLILVGFMYIFILSFIPYSLIKTYKYIQLSKHKEEKKWLLSLWRFETFLLSMVILLFILSPFAVETIASIIQIIALFTTLFIHWIAYSGIYKLKLKSDREKVKALLTVKIFNSNKIKNTTTDNHNSKASVKINTDLEKENTYLKELEELCLTKKIYRDSRIDRNKVAEMLGISPNYFSQIINSKTGNNFTTYINQYRVEDVKSFIKDEQFDNYSLLAIGLECGFSSKSSFHNTFKKFTGMTPNAYKKSLKKY
ncbi:helix-turn-helix domain-containing protein [Tenacibaculum sp. M341]|uniref:helix-turn-helix domain-containing protein n=1 Tax=Tenacibaculum sp. M341 TaxID=2530339 RepID=UPI001052AAB0|nr:helix-turn-helix domain-containing protein [Tenacibaculum sp. M341]TCI92279.1 AraC family transcriptional regulator [Tenacibaculum sp. M341]